MKLIKKLLPLFLFLTVLFNPIFSLNELIKIQLNETTNKFLLNISNLNLSLNFSIFLDSTTNLSVNDYFLLLDAQENYTYLFVNTSSKLLIIYVIPTNNNNRIEIIREPYYTITINNPNNYDLVDHQVLIDITNLSFMYFTILDSNNNTLNYCFEQPTMECNQTRTNKIWVKVPFISANGQTTIFVYKSSTNQAKNGKDVFDFYDDFNNGVLEPHWVNTINSPAVSFVDGWISIAKGGTSGYIESNFTKRVVDSFILETKQKQTLSDNAGSSSFDLGFLFSRPGISEVDPQIQVRIVDLNYRWFLRIQSYYAYSADYGSLNSVEVLYRVKYNRGNVFVEILNSVPSLPYSTISRSFSVSDTSLLRFKLGLYNGKIWTDFVRIRKYVDQEPTYSIQEIKGVQLSDYLLYLTNYSANRHYVKLNSINVYPSLPFYTQGNILYFLFNYEGNINVTKIVSINGTEYNQTSFDLSSFKEGYYTVDYGKVRANIDGFVLSDLFNISSWFVVDRTPPNISLNVQEPQEGYYTQKQNYSINVSVLEPNLDICYFDNDSFSLNYYYYTNHIGFGNHYNKITCFDKAGNKAEKEVSFDGYQYSFSFLLERNLQPINKSNYDSILLKAIRELDSKEVDIKNQEVKYFVSYSPVKVFKITATFLSNTFTRVLIPSNSHLDFYLLDFADDIVKIIFDLSQCSDVSNIILIIKKFTNGRLLEVNSNYFSQLDKRQVVYLLRDHDYSIYIQDLSTNTTKSFGVFTPTISQEIPISFNCNFTVTSGIEIINVEDYFNLSYEIKNNIIYFGWTAPLVSNISLKGKNDYCNDSFIFEFKNVRNFSITYQVRNISCLNGTYAIFLSVSNSKVGNIQKLLFIESNNKESDIKTLVAIILTIAAYSAITIYANYLGALFGAATLSLFAALGWLPFGWAIVSFAWIIAIIKIIYRGDEL